MLAQSIRAYLRAGGAGEENGAGTLSPSPFSSPAPPARQSRLRPSRVLTLDPKAKQVTLLADYMHGGLGEATKSDSDFRNPFELWNAQEHTPACEQSHFFGFRVSRDLRDGQPARRNRGLWQHILMFGHCPAPFSWLAPSVGH